MNETLPRAAIRAAKTNLVWLALPLIAFAIAVAWILSTDPLSGFRNGAPPIENLTFERTVLDDNGLSLLVRAGGSEPMTVAQVQVDDAYWQFTQDPPGPIARGRAAWLKLPFPWMLGEAHAVKVVTSTGATLHTTSPLPCRRRRRRLASCDCRRWSASSSVSCRWPSA